MTRRINSSHIQMTQAELDAGAGTALSGERIIIIDAVTAAPTGVTYDSGPAGQAPAVPVTASNINTVLQAAGGAGWEKAQATTANYVIARPTSGASLDLHVEVGGTLAAMLVANWPIPASGVDQLRIRNMSAVAQTFSATGYSGIVSADGNVATSGTYSIPVDMAVHITIDEDGWIQVAPMGQEVSQAEFDAAMALKAAATDLVSTVAMSAGYPTVSVTRSFTLAGKTLSIGQLVATGFSGVALNGTSIADGLLTSRFIANTLNTSVANEVSCWFGVVDGGYTKCVKAKLVNNGNNVDITATETGHWNGDVLADAGWTITGGVPASRQSTGAPASSNGAAGYGLETLSVTFNNFNIVKGTTVNNTLTSASTTEALSAAQGKALKDTADTLATTVGAKAPLSSPAFTDTPTAPTAPVATDTTQIATTAFVRLVVAALVDSSPAALDTLNELAAALGDDPNYAATITTALGLKQATSEKGTVNGYASLGGDGRVPTAQLPVSAGKLTYSDTDVSGNATIDATAAVTQPTVSQASGTVTTSAFSSTIGETHASTKWERNGVMGAADAVALLSKLFFSTTLGVAIPIRAAHVDSNGNQSQRSASVNVTTTAVSIAMPSGYPTDTVSKTFDHSDVTLALANIKTDSFTTATMGGQNIGGGGNGTNAAAYIANTLNIGVANEVSCWFGFYDGTYTKAVKAKFTVSAGNILINITRSSYWSGNVLSSASWTTAGAVPAGENVSTIASAINSGAYGLAALTVNFQA